MDEEQRFSMEGSIFEKTGQPILVSDSSVFGDDYSHSYQSGLLPPPQFRPLSVLSIGSVHRPADDGTMISVTSFKPQSAHLAESFLDAQGWSCSAPFSWLQH